MGTSSGGGGEEGEGGRGERGFRAGRGRDGGVRAQFVELDEMMKIIS